MSKRKILSLALTLCMVAILAVGGTLAFFVDTDSATNTFTVGNVDIKLTEPDWTTGEADGKEAYPGEALAKDPTVTNTGKNPCFVRIKVEGLDSLAPAGNIIYRTDYVDNKLGENWVEYDGYFYYTKVLTNVDDPATEAEENVTDALFDQIVIPKDVTNGYDGTYNVVVTAEAVQAQGALDKNWAGVNAMTIAEIAQWFDIAFENNTQG